MKTTLFLFLLLFSTVSSIAQTPVYGHIDTAELKLSVCDIDKGASAMILFDVAKITYNRYNSIIMERHKRIKIFNEQGAKQANIRLDFLGGAGVEQIKNIAAQTVNLINNQIEVTLLDPKLIYIEKTNKERWAKIFTMPNIKPGSVIDIKYTWQTGYPYNYPVWFFQNLIPTGYSELEASTDYKFQFNVIRKVNRKFSTDTILSIKDGVTKRVMGMANIPAFSVEPYMNAVEDNLQAVYFKPMSRSFSWSTIGSEILADKDFGGQLTLPLSGEEQLGKDAGEINTDVEKIAYIFNTVKNSMTWNQTDRWYSPDGLKKAWTTKTGNSTEINLILYHFLKRSGIKPSLMVLGTRDNGEIELVNPSFGRLNKTVVRVPIDSGYYYVLDASGKYNTYFNTPFDLLGLNMLNINSPTNNYEIVKLKTDVPSKEIVLVNAQIKASGKLEGNVQVSSSNYKRVIKLILYDKVGEKKYIEEDVKEGKNNLEISNYKIQNIENDTLPLREDFDFKMELTSADDNYIYIDPNLFTGVGKNPFLSESRLSDIDFIFLNSFSINGRYILPAGYKIDFLPKTLSIAMYDKSIVFKRVIGEMEGDIAIHYVIDIKKAKYDREEYPALRDFFKKMHELLSEQIVIKRS